MTTFLEFVRKRTAIPKDDADSLERGQWNLFVGDHLVGLYRKFYEKPLSYLRSVDIDCIDRQASGLLSLHLAYDWTFVDGSIAHASVLALNGKPVCAWRKQGLDNDILGLTLLDPNLAERLARWVHDLAGLHAPVAAKEPVVDVNAWLWEGNDYLAPAGSDDTFFYTVQDPERLAPVSQLVTTHSYVPSIESGLLPMYELGAVQKLHGDGRKGMAAVAHTLNGPRSVDVRNLVHSVLPEEQVRGQDLESLQKSLALDDYWFLDACTAVAGGWSCVVGVHLKGRVYIQWHIMHWVDGQSAKAVDWRNRIGERQPGTFNSDIIAAMEWQLGQ